MGSRSTAELLAELVEAARDWNDTIAEISSTLTNGEFSEPVIKDMHSALNAELERRRYDALVETHGQVPEPNDCTRE